jgi:hypothetical protein
MLAYSGIAASLAPLNWYGGWVMVLVGVAAGAVLGLRFDREDFLGGYGSFRRRIARLGHIAAIALGLINVIVSFQIRPDHRFAPAASACFLAAAVVMPLVCFLSVWSFPLRRLFPVPVTLLILAIVFTLLGGPP